MRLALCFPFALLALVALVLVVVSAGAWGAASEVRYPDALPTIGGLIFALPTLLFSVVAGYLVWRRTGDSFRIAPRRLLLGLLPILMAVGLQLSYALVIGDTEWYRGGFDAVKQRWNPQFEPKAFIAVTVCIAVAAPMGVFAAAAWWFYYRAISVAGLREPEGEDPIGEIARTGGAFPTR